MRLKRLNSFLLSEFFGTFGATFFVCLFVVLMEFLFRYVDEMVGKGLAFSVLFEFFSYAALSLVPMALPLAILLASLITFGGFGERLELLSMKAAGISLTKIMRPFLIVMCFMSIGIFLYSELAIPAIQTKLWTLLYSMKSKSPEVEIPEGSFYSGIEGYNFYVRRKDNNTKLLYDIKIYDFSKGFDNAVVMAADSGRLKSSDDKLSMVLMLYSGESFENLKEQNTSASSVPYRRETFSYKEVLIDFDANFSQMDESVISNKYMGKNLSELTCAIDSMMHHADSLDNAMRLLYWPTYFDRGLLSLKSITQYDSLPEYGAYTFEKISAGFTPNDMLEVSKRAVRNVNRLKVDMPFVHMAKFADVKRSHRFDIERHRKFTLSLACIVFFLIGAPLGAIVKKGGIGLPAVYSIILFILYYVIDNTGYKMARDGVWMVWQGVWLSTIVLLPLGLFLTYEAAHDRSINISMPSFLKKWMKKWRKKSESQLDEDTDN
ncbi:MAG: LptF/LptG family permease [Paludibacteraceae bacterium]|nr:LptF/LptG family permease [Paludibacteraceae bacterium]